MPQATKAEETQSQGYYEYESLRDKHFCRYLILQPASTETNPLVCTLHTAPLNEFPEFETISYVWGKPFQNQPITCNGKILRITASLRDALRQVRLAEKPRTLWADSICINQLDLGERGHQISLMGDLYNKSSCTLICLGRFDHAHAPIVASLVADVDSMVQNVFGRAGFSYEWNSFPLADEGNPLVSDSRWESFAILLRQPWFRRGWVVQEAALSSQTLLLWADTEIDWWEMIRAYTWSRKRALKASNQQLRLSSLHVLGFHIRRNREAITFYPEGAISRLTFLEILDCGRSLGVTDPRDRIYAFLGLPSSDNCPVRPDYDVPISQVYRDFAYEYVRRTGDLDILHFVQNNDSALEDNTASWIPHWNINLCPTGYSPTNYNKLNERIMPRLSYPKAMVSQDQNTLEIRVAIMDTVEFAGRTFDKTCTTPDDIASLWDSVSARSAKSPYSCSPLRAFVEIFRCAVYRGRLTEWERLESAYMRFLQHELHRGDASYDDAQRFHELRMEDVHNRKFIVSSRGYHGLVPKTVQQGDACCLIFGTRSPFILRKTDRDRHYKLLGSALFLGKGSDHHGYPSVMGKNDLDDWGLEEKDVFLC